MKIGIIYLAMLLASSTVFAQKTLITEIEASDLWLESHYSSSSADLELKGPIDSVSSSVDTNEVLIGITKAFDLGSGATPILSIDIGNSAAEGESTTIYSALAGAKLHLDEERNLVVFASYNGSGDDKVKRSGMEAGILFGIEGKGLYSELSLSTTLPEDSSTVEGGNSVDIVNSIKITPAHNLVLTGLLGVSLVSDIDIGDDYTVSSDPSFMIGGEAEMFFNKTISAALSIRKGVGNGDVDTSGMEVDAKTDMILAKISLNARF